MTIQHLLYRCPRCGHDPTTATAKGARCDSCGTSFERGRASVVRVRSADGAIEEVSVRSLMDSMEGQGGALSSALDQGGSLSYAARVVVAHGDKHEPVWWKSKLLGFFERIRECREGVLRIDDTGITITIPECESLIWPFETIQAIQISSKAIQLNIQGVGLYQLEFTVASPKRWEDLLHSALRRFYESRGLEIMEFQPRIATRSFS